MTITAGLDVGGAHLKVALVESGHTIAVRQIACPLWQGLDTLEAAILEARPMLARAQRFAVTMTGELSDLFPDRKTGVETLVRRMSAELGETARFWMGPCGFGSAEDACNHARDVGSTNFLATAALAARAHPDALLIDFGSTTADIIPVRDGKPCPRGLTDAERQATGELVYTGFTRTAVMGVASRAPFKGQWVTLAREYLATMADVRRILGANLDELDLHGTADGKGKSLDESVTRLARMLGRDGDDGTLAEWRIAASYLREEQLRSIHDGALLVCSRAALAAAAPVIAAGIGAGDVALIAQRLGRPVIAFAELSGATGASVTDNAEWATACAPAVAVALLLCGDARA
ncbi:MAG: hydantoinase/oxoprolinase family protein [Hyphomicrobium sp.]|jgi:probable H4MPT-linked C1 transfer pathway protein